MPISALLKSRDDSASAGVHTRRQSSTREARSPHTQAQAACTQPPRAPRGGRDSVVLVRPADHAQHVKESKESARAWANSSP